MAKSVQKLPIGKSQGVVVTNATQLGSVARDARVAQGLTQLDVAGMGNTGNRFVIELEKGKPTLQLQKVLDALSLLGLEVVVRPRGSKS